MEVICCKFIDVIVYFITVSKSEALWIDLKINTSTMTEHRWFIQQYFNIDNHNNCLLWPVRWNKFVGLKVIVGFVAILVIKIKLVASWQKGPFINCVKNLFWSSLFFSAFSNTMVMLRTMTCCYFKDRKRIMSVELDITFFNK